MSAKKILENFVKDYLLLESKNSGILALIDELYRMNDSIQDEEQKFKKLRNEISMYLGGPNAPKGSSRMVFPLDGKRVIKLALNPAGFAQNGTEQMAGIDSQVSDIINPVVAESDVVKYGGFFWIVQEKVLPLSVELVGDKNWSYFQSLLMKSARSDDEINPDANEYSTAEDPEKTKVEIPAAAAKKRQAQKKSDESEVSKKAVADVLRKTGPDFFDSFRQFLKRYAGSRTADLFKPDSWGMTPDGKLKLIDYGYTRQISDKFYEQGFVVDANEMQKRLELARQKSEKNVATNVADNEDTLMNAKNLPPLMSLLVMLKGVVLGLPRRVEEFQIGKPLSAITETEKASIANVIRSKQDIVEKTIEQVSNEQLKNKLYDELDEFLLSSGSLGKKQQQESLIRVLVRETLTQLLK